MTPWAFARMRWERFWFAPGDPLNLAAARVVLALQGLWILLSRDLPALSALPAAFWSDVSPAARWRYLLWEGHPAAEAVVEAVALAALAGALLGVRARACCAAAGLLLYHLAPLQTLFYTPSPWPKGLTLCVPGLIALALAPCDRALALRRGSGAAADWEYGWALRLVMFLVAQPYLSSGWAKLVHGGWAWASSENIRAWLLLSNLDDQIAPFSSAGLWLADRPLLCLAMGIAGLVFDLVFVAAVFSPRARLVLVPAAFVFHGVILFTQNYAFLTAPLLLVFVDWAVLERRFLGVRADATAVLPSAAARG
jgi:hypothetical protein